MPMTRIAQATHRLFAVLTLLGTVPTAACLAPSDSITLMRIPEGGRMPHAAVDSDGTIHLMYFRGAMTGGDLLYVRRPPTATEWSMPVRINSEPRTAIGMGPMDGGDMALDVRQTDGGRLHRLHVVWFRNDPLRFVYTRSTEDGPGFEPQRVLLERGDEILEARPSVTTDGHGQVFVAWHGGTVEKADDAHRAVFLMTSHDGGDSFEPPVVISRQSEGACGCCSLETFAADDTVWVSYRAAGENVRRGQHLLRSTQTGPAFVDQLIQPWPIGACPVTTTTFARGPDVTRVAWETDGQVYFASIDDLSDAVSPGGDARFRRKNPVIATNQRGDTLLAWGDAPGYRAGGTLNWQLFDGEHRPLSDPEPGTDTIPSGSTPAIATQPDGTFVLLY